MAVALVHAVLTSLRVLNVVDYSICVLLYCAGEPVHFQEHLSLLH